ncbi:MAG TPA: hypothetical protein DFS52_29545 [Myxococcales bacterium]|nr:hypothetical protein [Myxococcales bacterium]
MKSVLPLGATSIELEGALPESVRAELAGFSLLPCGPGITLSVLSATPARLEARRGLIASVHGIWELGNEGHSLAVYARELSTEMPVVRFDLEGAEGELRIAPSIPDWALVPAVVSVGLQVLSMRLLAERGGVLLHASGIACERAILFVGPSGAGKTTAARNSRAKATTFCDDRAVVYLDRGGEYRVLASPFQQRSRSVPGDHPLAALCLLTQALRPRVRELSRARGVARLASRAFLPLWDRQAVERSLSFLGRLARRVPTVDLELADSPSFLALLEPWLCPPTPPSRAATSVAERGNR